jgi:hypothetical protein
MLVVWTTRDRGLPLAKYGAKSGTLSSRAAAETATYDRGDLCGGVANSTGFLDPGLFHSAVLTGLAPDQEYFYVYGDEVRGKPVPCMQLEGTSAMHAATPGIPQTVIRDIPLLHVILAGLDPSHIHLEGEIRADKLSSKPGRPTDAAWCMHRSLASARSSASGRHRRRAATQQ